MEIVPEVSPPVCKLANYGKYKYEIHRKEKDARKKQKTILVKEIKIRPKIDEHDLQTKIKHVIRREMAHTDIGRKILERIIEMLKEISVVEQTPKLEGRNMTIVISPRRENAKT